AGPSAAAPAPSPACCTAAWSGFANTCSKGSDAMTSQENVPGHEEHFGEVLAAYLEAADAGWAPPREELLARYPAYRAELEAFFAARDQVDALAEPFRATLPPAPHLSTPAEGEPHPATGPGELPRSCGDYELLQEVARGGMGIVYKARQKSLNRIVALKMILSGRLANAADVQRFRNEAEAA